LVADSLNMMDLDEEQIGSMNLSESDIVKYQKIPLLDAMNKIYKDIKDLLKDESDEDATKIEKSFRNLLELVQSYDVIKKIEV